MLTVDVHIIDFTEFMFILFRLMFGNKSQLMVNQYFLMVNDTHTEIWYSFIHL
jgi:hypothetical protein